MLIHYKYEDEESPSLDHANVVIAAFTTAQARIELYKYLEMLGDRVQYFDTDAVIYTVKPGEETIEISDFLGGMTDELVDYGVGSYATEFVSGGPKNYALKVYSTTKNAYTYICKVKGITLNSENVKHINFDTIRSMITDSGSPRSICVENKHKTRGPVNSVDIVLKKVEFGRLSFCTLPRELFAKILNFSIC
jgi:hypothetical protein